MLVIRTKAFPFPKNYKIFKQILPPLPPPKRHCVVLTSNMTPCHVVVNQEYSFDL